uniref:Uncharacterized protein n=1 Tax=Glossina pallidipes TaxID=7398 RepID=A0A1A9ZTB6_GLOPL
MKLKPLCPQNELQNERVLETNVLALYLLIGCLQVSAEAEAEAEALSPPPPPNEVAKDETRKEKLNLHNNVFTIIIAYDHMTSVTIMTVCVTVGSDGCWTNMTPDYFSGSSAIKYAPLGKRDDIFNMTLQ